MAKDAEKEIKRLLHKVKLTDPALYDLMLDVSLMDPETRNEFKQQATEAAKELLS